MGKRQTSAASALRRSAARVRRLRRPISMHGGAVSTRGDGTKKKYFWDYIDLLGNASLRIFRL